MTVLKCFGAHDKNSEDNAQTLKPHSYQIQERLSRINKWDDYIVSSYNDRSFSSTSYVGKEGDGTVEFRIRAWNNFGSSEWSEVMPCPQRPKTCAKYQLTMTMIDWSLMLLKYVNGRNRSFLSHLFDIFSFFKDLYIWAYIVFTVYLFVHTQTYCIRIDRSTEEKILHPRRFSSG